jgi:hypothetical protein
VSRFRTAWYGRKGARTVVGLRTAVRTGLCSDGLCSDGVTCHVQMQAGGVMMKDAAAVCGRGKKRTAD